LRQHDNSFFGDPILFQLASSLSAPLLSELAELGAYTVSDETENRARLVMRHRPLLHLYDNSGERCEEIDLHPAYHSLLMRARHAGIASSLFEEGEAQGLVRHQARALRLMLLSGVECATLQELCLSSAALAVLHREEALCREWKPLLVSRTHDPLLKPYPQKQAVSLSFALQDQDEGEKAQVSGVYRVDEGLPEVVRIHGRKSSVINPLADGFLVRALFEGQECLFLVPRLLADGRLNGVRLSHCADPVSACVASPCADLCFSASAGWRLGAMGEAQTLLNQVQTSIQFDMNVMLVGALRRVLRLAVDKMRHDKKNGQIGQAAIQARILADAALDCAAAAFVVLRIAQAFDRAGDNAQEAVLAEFASPLVGYWLERIAVQILDCCRIYAPLSRPVPGGIHDRMTAHLSLFHGFKKAPLQRLVDSLSILQAKDSSVHDVIAQLETDCGGVGAGSGEVLRAGVAMAHEDPSVACLLAEQFIYMLATASMRKLDMEIVSSAFINSRLGGAWRSSYGSLSLRFNPTFILETLYPSA